MMLSEVEKEFRRELIKRHRQKELWRAHNSRSRYEQRLHAAAEIQRNVTVKGEAHMGKQWTECQYCGREAFVNDETTVPSKTDDTAWAKEARQHYKNCEWIRTRAFQ